MVKVYLGSDHGGFFLKKELAKELASWDIELLEREVFSTDSVDYPDVAASVCNELLKDKGAVAILICGTGIGISIAANKINGIRAALCSDEYSARMAKIHNNANVLCLGGRVVGFELAKSIIKAFLESSFEGGRHQRRLDKLEA
jgi:ribose 5-phosphate isomerase B